MIEEPKPWPRDELNILLTASNWDEIQKATGGATVIKNGIRSLRWAAFGKYFTEAFEGDLVTELSHVWEPAPEDMLPVKWIGRGLQEKE